MLPVRKRAGWRWHSETYWAKGAQRQRKECGKESLLHDSEAESHERDCPKAPVRATLRGPDLPVMPMSCEREPVIEAVLRSVSRADKPEKSAAWTEHCRRGACINCGKPPRSTISHEPSGAVRQAKGVSQKVRDTLGTPLCWEPCHRVLTATGCLPDPRDSERKGKLVMRSREETLQIIHAAQFSMLRSALDRLSLEWQIEALSIALAKVPEQVLRDAVLGDEPPTVGALLDATGDEP